MATLNGQAGTKEMTRDSVCRDVVLLRRYSEGDPAAIIQIYECFRDPVLRFVLRRCQSTQEDAEEITNDIFVAALRLATTYDGTCSVLTWLCSIGRNRIIDHGRRQKSSNRVPVSMIHSIDDESRRVFRHVHDESISPESIVSRMDCTRVVEELLATLRPDQRELLVMHYVEGFSVPEIARIMGRTEKSVEHLLQRAKEKPRKELAHWLGDDRARALCLEVLVL